MNRRRLPAICLAALALVPSACRRFPSSSRGYVSYSHPGGLFECQVPKGWTASPPEYPGSPKALFLSPAPGTAKPDQTLSALWVQYYGPDSIYADPAGYVRIQLLPGPGRLAEGPEERKFGGRNFQFINVTRPAAGRSLSGSDARVRETIAVLKGANGFYVLGLSLPFDRPLSEPEAALRADFEHLVQTFRPGR